jgi:tryptophan synthase alpha chain
MSYYNILFKYGVERFAGEMKRVGLAGSIVPDLPLEEAGEYTSTMAQHDLAAVRLFAPNTPDQRMRMLSEGASGFVYCVARKGVTGATTNFSSDLDAYLARARRATSLPLAVGFGLKDRKDVDFLRGKAEIAIIGSESLRILNESGVRATGDFIKTLVS